MKGIITFFSAMFFCTLLSAQVTVWQEDFTYIDGTTFGTGNRWTTTTSGGPNYFEVKSNEFRASDTNVIDQLLETEIIDISSYANVKLSVDVRLVSGDTEVADYIKVYYVLDGGAEIVFANNGENFDAFNTVASQSGLNGTNVKIRIKVRNSAATEIYGIDNILVVEELPAFFDSDGDGILDDVDIDDDNDGIIDINEENSCRNSLVGTTTNYKFLNETFGTGGRTTINTNYNATTTYCYEDGNVGTNTGSCPSLSSKILDDGEYCVVSKITGTTAGDPDNIHGDLAWYQGADHTGDTDGRMAVFNASFTPGVFYETTITGVLSNMPITYSFWALNIMAKATFPGSILPDVTVQFLDLSNNVLASINTGQFGRCAGGITDNSCTDGVWKQFTTSVNLGNVNAFTVRFINNAPGGGGNDLALDDILISQTLCDADGDGVADLFDLDSDNDGIPDVVEYGNGQYSNGTAKIPTGVWVDTNSNGMHDAAESSTGLDSDGDGVLNYLDLDSDNDTIFDVDESGAGNTGDGSFQNGDGDINGDGVGDGPDTDAFRETDTNSDNVLEYFTDGILDVYDFFEGGSYVLSYGNENQGSTGAGWGDYVIDTDNDGLPDYMDITSDGSTFDISTTLYANLDTDSNGYIDGSTDTDGDGILDLFDTNDASFGSPRDLDRKLHLYFDGRNDYAEDNSIINSSEASLMGWIKIDPTATGNQVLFGQNEFYLQLKSDKKIETIANGNTVSNSTALTTNQWVHVAATYSSANSKLKLYVNGEIMDSTNVSGALPVDTSNFTIGKFPNVNSNYYKGYFDEVRVFDKSLSENEIHKMVYQEIENNTGNIRGSVIPRDVTDYINPTTIAALDWTSLKRCFRMDVYKDDIIDDLSTTAVDTGSGAKIYNSKIIEVQNAPLPFVTAQSGSLPIAIDDTSKGINGNDAILYDWSIVQIEHININYNNNQKHLGLIVNKLDVSSNPIEFSIQNDSELNISWYLKLDGFIDLDDESQLVQGDDSILDENSGGYIERDQQGTASSFNYNYWSSSVGPITVEGIGNGISSTNQNYGIASSLNDGTAATNPIGINFQAAYTAADIVTPSPIIISSYWLHKFNGTNNDYDSWISIDENTQLLAGEGFTMKGTSGFEAISTDQNYVYKGKPYNGTITLPVVNGNSRLIGNPYPSALDANKFILDNISDSGGNAASNIINGALYYWDHFSGSTHVLSEYVGGYATWNLIGGVKAISNDTRINASGALGVKVPGPYIPVNQAFFVSTHIDVTLTGIATVTGGTVTFKNSQRVHQLEAPSNSVFMKNTATKNKMIKGNKSNNEDVNPKIRLLFDSPKGNHRQILVGVNENTTSNFDLGYDAPLADLNTEDMFWMINENKFVIQGVNNFDNDQELPIGFQIEEEGLVKIKIDTLENINENTALFIKDNVTNKFHSINNKQFEINLLPGEYLNRFSLVFKPGETLEIEDEYLNSGIHVFTNNINEEIQIHNYNYVEINSINLINSIGQKINTWNNNFINKIVSLPINSNLLGVYIIQINTSLGKITKKIIID